MVVKSIVSIPTFKGERNDDFHLWSLRVNAALRGRKIGRALTDEEGGREDTDEALSIILSALGDNRLAAVRNCNTVKKVFEAL